MSEKNIVYSEFSKAFENIINKIDFLPSWTEDYNGFWNGAVLGYSSPNIAVGGVAKTVDNSGRRAIFIGSREGNIVLFDRCCPANNDGDWQVAYQVPRDHMLIWFFGRFGVLDHTRLHQFINPMNPSENISSTLDSQ